MIFDLSTIDTKEIDNCIQLCIENKDEVFLFVGEIKNNIVKLVEQVKYLDYLPEQFLNEVNIVKSSFSYVSKYSTPRNILFRVLLYIILDNLSIASENQLQLSSIKNIRKYLSNLTTDLPKLEVCARLIKDGAYDIILINKGSFYAIQDNYKYDRAYIKNYFPSQYKKIVSLISIKENEFNEVGVLSLKKFSKELEIIYATAICQYLNS